MNRVNFFCYCVFILLPVLAISQGKARDYETDYITDSKGIRLNCKIVKINNGRVKYRLFKQSQPFVVNIMNLSDIHLNEESEVLKNWPNQIKYPEKGFAHVYLFYADDMGGTILYNGNKLISLRRPAYFLHKIEIGKEHQYWIKGNDENEILTLKPRFEEVLLIRPVPNENAKSRWFANPGGTGMIHGFTNPYRLKITNDKLSEYVLLSLKKKLEK